MDWLQEAICLLFSGVETFLNGITFMYANCRFLGDPDNIKLELRIEMHTHKRKLIGLDPQMRFIEALSIVGKTFLNMPEVLERQ